MARAWRRLWVFFLAWVCGAGVALMVRVWRRHVLFPLDPCILRGWGFAGQPVGFYCVPKYAAVPYVAPAPPGSGHASLVPHSVAVAPFPGTALR
eukprot:gene23061-biopygen20796